jgi:radical SAM superfamily enzyme YgiQ (UPF0313 family)
VIPAYSSFNIYSAVANKTTALGPVCIASVVDKMEHWDAEVIDENNLRRYGPRSDSGGADHEFLQRQRPAGVVGFYGGLTSTIPRLYRLAQYYKEKGAITIAGGQHFSGDNISEALASNIDYVVVGEGEETIKELLHCIEINGDTSRIKGIAYLKDEELVKTPPREHITDFDQLPLPDFSLVRYAKIKIYPIERIRGCGMDCEFCTVKGRPRVAPAERMLEHIQLLVETRDARRFFVVDDLFGQQRGETIRLCRLLKDYQQKIGRRLNFNVQIRLDKAKDPELLSAMRQAGVNMVAIGFESPIAEELEAMNKHIKPEHMLTLTKVYRRFGFLIHGMFIFGYPLMEGVRFKMPTRERVKRFRTFIRKAKLDTIQILLAVPLPGTQLRERLEKQKRIFPKEDVGWEYYDGNFPLFEPDEPITAEEMQTSVRRIMGKFYQFKYFFYIGLNILSFPSIVFFLHNITLGWEKWYRSWRNALLRFGGWAIQRGWRERFKRDNFLQKLHSAQEHLKNLKTSH